MHRLAAQPKLVAADGIGFDRQMLIDQSASITALE